MKLFAPICTLFAIVTLPEITTLQPILQKSPIKVSCPSTDPAKIKFPIPISTLFAINVFGSTIHPLFIFFVIKIIF